MCPVYYHNKFPDSNRMAEWLAYKWYKLHLRLARRHYGGSLAVCVKVLLCGTLFWDTHLKRSPGINRKILYPSPGFLSMAFDAELKQHYNELVNQLWYYNMQLLTTLWYNKSNTECGIIRPTNAIYTWNHIHFLKVRPFQNVKSIRQAVFKLPRSQAISRIG